MKKRMSRILSALLVSALVMSAGNVVQAEDGGEKAAGKPKVEAEAITGQAEGVQTLGTLSTDAAKEITAQATDPVIGSIPLNKRVTGNEKNDNWKDGYIEYYSTSAYKIGDKYGYKKSVSLKKGTLDMLVTPSKYSYGTNEINFGLYKDANLTQKVDGEESVTVNNSREKIFKISKDGTYYIGVYSKMSPSTDEEYPSAGAGATVTAVFCDGRDRTLTSGKQVAVGVKAAQTTYFKFKVTKAGYISVPYIDGNAGGYSVTLCNSKKKALSNATPLRYSPTYGVKKGTYWIKVKSTSNSVGGYAFKVTSNSSIKEKSGKSKAKAVSLKKGKAKKGTNEIGKKEADWYKLKKTNTKYMKVTVEGRTNNKLTVWLYRGGKKITKKSFKYGEGNYIGKGCYFELSGYPKGTYYIKIEGDKKSSGWYSVKWTQ